MIFTFYLQILSLCSFLPTSIAVSTVCGDSALKDLANGLTSYLLMHTSSQLVHLLCQYMYTPLVDRHTGGSASLVVQSLPAMNTILITCSMHQEALFLVLYNYMCWMLAPCLYLDLVSVKLKNWLVGGTRGCRFTS